MCTTAPRRGTFAEVTAADPRTSDVWLSAQSLSVCVGLSKDRTAECVRVCVCVYACKCELSLGKVWTL